MEIAFDVSGWPPLKNEAKSMLAASHRQHESVRALLEAAALASQQTGWTPVTADIALDVIVRTPSARPPGDATNYLGGIGDVLQDKSHRSTSTFPTSAPFKRPPSTSTTVKSVG